MLRKTSKKASLKKTRLKEKQHTYQTLFISFFRPWPLIGQDTPSMAADWSGHTIDDRWLVRTCRPWPLIGQDKDEPKSVSSIRGIQDANAAAKTKPLINAQLSLSTVLSYHPFRYRLPNMSNTLHGTNFCRDDNKTRPNGRGRGRYTGNPYQTTPPSTFTYNWDVWSRWNHGCIPPSSFTWLHTHKRKDKGGTALINPICFDFYIGFNTKQTVSFSLL